MAKEEYISIQLPMPPSVNIAYAWKVRRYKSPEYQKWIQLADIEYSKNWFKGRITWDEWLEVNYNYFFSLYTLEWKKRVKDVWNYEKLLTDYLCTKIEWLEDHKIKIIKLEKHDSDKNYVKILIKEIWKK
jgi:Holliday junction resolvase RusA-like endonuclease